MARSTSAASRPLRLNCCGDRESHLLFVPPACSLFGKPVPDVTAEPGWRDARLSRGAGPAAAGTGPELRWPVCRRRWPYVWKRLGRRLTEGNCGEGWDGGRSATFTAGVMALSVPAVPQGSGPGAGCLGWGVRGPGLTDSPCEPSVPVPEVLPYTIWYALGNSI